MLFGETDGQKKDEETRKKPPICGGFILNAGFPQRSSLKSLFWLGRFSLAVIKSERGVKRPIM